MKTWYSFTCNANSELKVCGRLSEHHEVYVPLIDADKRKNHKYGKIPMFERYGFIRMQSGIDDFSQVVRTKGVISIISLNVNGGGERFPTPIQDSVIGAIRHAERISRRIDYQAGDSIRAIDGPFEGLTGEIIKAKSGRDRVKVLFIMFDKAVPVEINRRQIQPVAG